MAWVRISSARTQRHHKQHDYQPSSGDSRNSDRDTSDKNFYEFTVVETCPRTTHKMGAVLFGHEVNEVIYENFAENKKPPNTSSVRTTMRTLKATT